MQKGELAAEIREAIADDKMVKTQLYRAGRIAGLKEAAKVQEARIEEVLAAMDENGDDINDRNNPRSVALLTLNIAQQDIRARIAALETEEGK